MINKKIYILSKEKKCHPSILPTTNYILLCSSNAKFKTIQN